MTCRTFAASETAKEKKKKSTESILFLQIRTLRPKRQYRLLRDDKP